MPTPARPSDERPSTDDLPVLEFVRPVPGFPGHERFALVRLDDEGLLFSLRSVQDPALRFLVVPPSVFYPDYAPEVDDETAAALGVEQPEDALVLVVVTAGASLADSTANLLAPVVVGIESHRAAQVILDDPALAVATPLPVG